MFRDTPTSGMYYVLTPYINEQAIQYSTDVNLHVSHGTDVHREQCRGMLMVLKAAATLGAIRFFKTYVTTVDLCFLHL